MKWYVIYTVLFAHCSFSHMFDWHCFWLFILPYVWLTLFLLLFDVLSCCVLLISCFLCGCCLIDHCWLWVLFDICLVFICFRMSFKGSVTMCLSNWSKRYYLNVIHVSITCLLFLVISHPFFVICIVYGLLLWSWSPFLLLYHGSTVHQLHVELLQ